MSTQRPTFMIGFGVPWALPAPDTGATTDYSEAGAQAGIVASTSEVRIDATGAPTVLVPPEGMTVRASGAGAAGRDGAQFLAKVGGADWFGWDAPQFMRGRWVVGAAADTGLPNDFPSTAALDTGTLLVADAYPDSGNNVVRIHRRARDGSFATTTVAIAEGSGTKPALPALCPLPDGRCLLFVLVHENGTQVRTLETDNDGATWAVVANYTLASTIDSGTVIDRMSAAATDSQVLLLMGSTASTDKRIEQYASRDEGSKFTLVESGVITATTALGCTLPDLVTTSDGFAVIVTDTATTTGTGVSRPAVAVIASAFTPLSTAFTTSLATLLSTDGTFAKMASICADQAGALWAHVLEYGPLTSDGAQGHLATSADGGRSWSRISPVGGWWQSLDDASFPWGFTTSYSDGAVYMAHNRRDRNSAVDDGRDAGVLRLGGYAEITLPSADLYPSIANSLAPDFAYAGGDPADCGFTLAPGTATATGSNDGDGWLTVEATGTAHRWFDDFTTDHGEGVVIHTVVQQVTGTLYVQALVSDGTDMWTVDIQITDSLGIDVFDGPGNDLGSISFGTNTIEDGVELRIALSSAGVTVGARAYKGVESAPFIVLNSAVVSETATAEGAYIGTVSTGGGIGAGRFRIMSYARATSGQIGNTYANDWASPADVNGFTLSSQSRYVANGYSLTAAGGPARLADSFDLPVAFDYPVANLQSESPRDEWRDYDTNGGQFEWTVESLDDGFQPETGVVYVYFRNCNFPRAVVAHTDGIAASFSVELLDADLTTAMAYKLTGSQIRPATTGDTVLGPYVRKGQLVGSHFALEDGTVLPITSNSSGWLTSGTTIAENRAVITLGGMEAGQAATGDGAVWHKDMVFVVHGQNNPIGNLRLKLYPESTVDATYPQPYGGQHRIGLFSIGDVHILPDPSSYGRRITMDRGVDLQNQAGGRLTARRNRPMSREVAIPFADGLMTHRIDGSNDARPIYGQATGGTPVASSGGTPGLLLGLADSVDVGNMLFLPRIDQGDASTRRYLPGIADSPIWGKPGTTLSYEQVTGEEQLDEVVRVPNLTISEVT